MPLSRLSRACLRLTGDLDLDTVSQEAVALLAPGLTSVTGSGRALPPGGCGAVMAASPVPKHPRLSRRRHTYEGCNVESAGTGQEITPQNQKCKTRNHGESGM